MQSSLDRTSSVLDESAAEAAQARVISLVRRRHAPQFIICDSALRVLYSVPGLERITHDAGRFELLRAPAREALRSGSDVIHAFDDETILRIVPLDSGLFGCVAIFVDVFSRRGSINGAAKTFQLTKRETQVLRLVVTGKSNPQIAVTLFVAESTVADHVKSIMRKMDVNKRIEIMSKLFHLEHDVV